jgi:signal transduction histidine kinase
MRPDTHARIRPPRATLLVGLLVLALVLAVLLGYEAHQAIRSHRVTAERAVRNYASFVARDVAAGVREQAQASLADALAPATRGKLVSPYAPLPSVALLDTSAATAFRCGNAEHDTARVHFRLDLRDSALATSGAPPSPRLRTWVRDTVSIHARATFRPESRYAAIIGAGAWSGRAIIYGVKIATHGAPVAAYGFVTCSSALGAPLFAAPARHAAATALAAGSAADSLLSLTVTDASGRVLYATEARWSSPFTGEARLDQLGALRVQAAVHPAALDRLFAGTATGPSPTVLLAMLVLTAGLGVVALVQLRREHELARQRADFTSSVSHELRTPLSQILLYGETLSLDRVRSEDDRRHAAEVIVHEAQRLMHMVENVLHFARGERGEYALSVRPVPLASQLRSILTAFAPLAESARVRLRAELDEDVIAVADPGALRQIMLNLLDNAVKYGPPGQVVTVSATRQHDRVVIGVEDEGPGIPREERERVWRPFVRLRSRRDGPHGGSGIGLSVVWELVRRQGGSVHVGAGANGGALITVSLPLAAVDDRSRVASQAWSDSNGRPAGVALESTAVRDGRRE